MCNICVVYYEDILCDVVIIGNEYLLYFVFFCYVYKCGQLFYVVIGVVMVIIDVGSWVVLLWWVLWIFFGVVYEVCMSGIVFIYSVYVCCEVVEVIGLLIYCWVIEVLLLLYVLLYEVVDLLVEYVLDGCDGWVMVLLLDEFVVMLVLLLNILLLCDVCLVCLCWCLFDVLVLDVDIDVMVQQVGMSWCNFMWLFCCQIGMSFVSWCQQVCLFVVLICFGCGELVICVVVELGYGSFSVFIVVFCCVFGDVFSCYFMWYGCDIGN